MELAMAIVPILIAGIISLYVINRLKNLSKEGKLGKKKLKGAQGILDSLIPLGMMFGCVIGVVFGLFFQLFLPFTISLGTSIGYLLGFFAFKSYSKEASEYSWKLGVMSEYYIVGKYNSFTKKYIKVV